MVVWDGEMDMTVWPTHYWRADGELKPTGMARYKLGDTVQMKWRGAGPVTIVGLRTYQYRWHKPDVQYVLSDGRRAFDNEVF
jgi:hypothetical protein